MYRREDINQNHGCGFGLMFLSSLIGVPYATYHYYGEVQSFLALMAVIFVYGFIVLLLSYVD